ncbi:hypothetical protein [Nocardia heshunensis]
MADPDITVKWKKEPDEHDYPAAADYLEMLADQTTIDKVVQELRAAPIVYKKAKDLLRASALDALPTSNPYVRRDLQKIVTGKALSPILVVRGDFRKGVPMVIADGYHRVCAIYYTDENIAIPVKIAALP